MTEYRAADRGVAADPASREYRAECPADREPEPAADGARTDRLANSTWFRRRHHGVTRAPGAWRAIREGRRCRRGTSPDDRERARARTSRDPPRQGPRVDLRHARTTRGTTCETSLSGVLMRRKRRPMRAVGSRSSSRRIRLRSADGGVFRELRALGGGRGAPRSTRYLKAARARVPARRAWNATAGSSRRPANPPRIATSASLVSKARSPSA